MKLTEEEKAVVARFEDLDTAMAKALFDAGTVAANPELERLRGEMRTLKANPYLYREAFGMRQPS